MTDKSKRICKSLGWIVLLLVSNWVLLSASAVLWLHYAVPLTAQDLAETSWLGSYSVAAMFNGFLGYAVVGIGLFVLLALSVAKNSKVPLIFSLLLLPVLFLEGTAVRVGIADGSVKIGCYVYEARECREMLNIPVENTLSRYTMTENGIVDAPWYVEARQKVMLNKENHRACAPFIPFLSTPFLLGKEGELRAKIAEQRQEVQRIRAAVMARNVESGSKQ